ncbi:hypothetical protein ACFL9S_11035 [Erwinia sp. AnSW2-5]|uniref:hypothetical protein n=1 Tax=Erwinia sp. AnSW2-5 TaxID=3367692 RepID=UPI00385807BD
MTEQEKQNLIHHCESVRDGTTFFDTITDYNKRHQQINEIALASLTAKPTTTMQPVKAPKQERGTYPPARIKQVRDMEWIRAIREAGGTVEE